MWWRMKADMNDLLGSFPRALNMGDLKSCLLSVLCNITQGRYEKPVTAGLTLKPLLREARLPCILNQHI